MPETKRRPVLLSGIQPTGNLTLGNYIGAIKNWVSLQESHDCLFVLVDLHTLTVRQDPAELNRRCYDFLALYIACGIDPERNTVFVQSHVPAHSQLTWILNCYTAVGELNRMSQFKLKATQHAANVNAGLFDYPALMAADILLYRTDLVPVGEDQKQHLELTRDLAQRFNALYGDVFTVPEAYIPTVGARIRSLQDPTAKMSKSDANPNAYLALLDDPKTLRKKIMRAVTDSGREIVYDEDRPGVANLMTIYSALTGESHEDIQRSFEGKGYGDLKKAVADAVVEFMEPVHRKYHEIREDAATMSAILKRGAEVARLRARPVLDRVHEVLGLIPA